ncbi:mitochondrial carrier domain-containing protein [Xylaria intraflava]|nr:mitochondrial carrier domain-containing protein [Xylaria intraflava]
MSAMSETLPASPGVKQTKVQPWAHLVAGASGGAANSIITSPLDVVRTQLQSGLYRSASRQFAVGHGTTHLFRLFGTPFTQFTETFDILRSIQRHEGWRGLYRGLGPSLIGVVPTSAMKFYAYGNCKHLGASYLDRDEKDPIVHACAAAAAGIATATATNPLYLVKTRLQLDKSRAGAAMAARRYNGSLDCLRQVLQKEGVPGLYRGLGASYLGVVETVVYLVLYERLKVLFSLPLFNHAPDRNPALEELGKWANTSSAAGCAKLTAVLITYPHEVVRTRLRQAPTAGGRPVYGGISHCFRQVWQQEGLRGLYGGLTPHAMRAVPSAIISLGVYEFVLRLINPPAMAAM